jgi:UDP-glucose 4-epimerase
MRVLVTGGAGFIGANLTARLLAHPRVAEVVVLDDLSTGSLANLSGVGATVVEGSILDEQALAAAAGGVDAIVHLAAVPSVPRSLADPLRSHEANATGTLRVLQAARAAGNAPVVLASSSSVYGANPQLPKVESMRPMPVSPYAVSKLATECYALSFAACFDLPVLPLRFFNVFGPLQAPGHAYAAVVPTFVDAALSARPVPVHGDGRQTRDFTFVDTVTEVITRAVVDRVHTTDPVNLAFGTRTSLLEVLDQLEEILGHPVERVHQPPRPGDVRDSQADNARLRALFPDVRPVPLAEGLARTVDWLRGARAAAAVAPSASATSPAPSLTSAR